MSPCRSDYIFTDGEVGVWHVVSEDLIIADQSFLLIARIRRIFTARLANTVQMFDCRTSTAEYTDIPAYSQILLGKALFHLGPFLFFGRYINTHIRVLIK